MTRFVCLVLYKCSQKFINKDKNFSINPGSFLWPQGCNERWKELLPWANPEKVLLPLGQGSFAFNGCCNMAERRDIWNKEPSSFQYRPLTGCSISTLASTVPLTQEEQQSFHSLSLLRLQDLGGHLTKLSSIYTMKTSFQKCTSATLTPGGDAWEKEFQG